MLHEIFKGMDNAAEQINDNFKNATIVDTGSNEDGDYFVLGNGYVFVFGHKVFNKPTGWKVGDNQSFDNSRLPTAYKSPYTVIFSDYNAELYDGSSAFYDVQTRVTKINPTSGNVEVIKQAGSVSTTNNLTIRYLHIGKIIS